MKNLFLPIALATILLTSCSKDDSIEQTELQTADTIYTFTQINDTQYWDSFTYNIITNNVNRTPDKPIKTEGYYQPSSRNGMSITWSGKLHTNGISTGFAELKQTSPDTNFHFILETECVSIIGNEAVYGGTIVEIKSISGNAPNISEGWKFYFKVDDYELYPNAPNDQISNTTLFVSQSLCNSILPNDTIWESNGYSEVFKPGFVVVNN